MIDRKELVQRHNPHLTEVVEEAPLTVGNGEFAFTADVTGMQTLYEEYACFPLCTQAQWGWHTTPVSRGKYAYTRRDLELTPFETYGRVVEYPVERRPGNEQVYQWLRQNPHRLNLGRIGLVYRDKPVAARMLSGIEQTLDLYTGVLTSRFVLGGKKCTVKTCVSPDKDQVSFVVESGLLAMGWLKVMLRFPYGSPEMTASDWEQEMAHESRLKEERGGWRIQRVLDRDRYTVAVASSGKLSRTGIHEFAITSSREKLNLSVAFSRGFAVADQEVHIPFDASEKWWKGYWEQGGMVSFAGSSHPRAEELERRVVLSQYLTAVQCAGSLPPQETGLSCNSWYGCFHLEMHFWHSIHFHFWGRTALLERSMGWYVNHLADAQALASRQGYRGARWPKMATMSTTDLPSPIAPLLIWQQPHVAWYLECCYEAHPDRETLLKYRDVMFETAEFMADYAVYDKKGGRYVLGPPLIPAQENHDPKTAMNPTYELEYWRFALSLALLWKKRLGEKEPEHWREVAKKLAKLPVKDGVYLAQENCPDTFGEFAKDHPSMLCAYGLLPPGRIDPKVMSATLDKVLECWDFPSMWGWDFGVMAMTATLLGRPETAVELLLKETEKNYYAQNGNNRQLAREDLPLYLPGNGSLLLAVAMMARGNSAVKGDAPGFPGDGQWKVEWEGLRPMY